IFLRAIVETQVKLGDIEGALKTASAFDRVYDKAKALLEIGTAQVEAGKLADARETLFRAACAAEDTKPGIRGDRLGPSGPSEHVLGTTLRLIAVEQARAGDIKQALRTVKSISGNANARDVALIAIVQTQAKAGEVKGGLETLEQIQDENE